MMKTDGVFVSSLQTEDFYFLSKEFNELQSLDIYFVRDTRLEPANRPIDQKQ